MKLIQKSAAASLKPTLLELGGKNALLGFPGADVEKLALGVARSMNFTGTGQSCGSTSRVFLHESIHDALLDKVMETVKKEYKAGVPTEMSTTMGPVINKVAFDQVMSYVEFAKSEWARLVMGGKVPNDILVLEDSLSSLQSLQM